jgi:hypothetical protein
LRSVAGTRHDPRDGPSARVGGEASMEAAIGIALVIIAIVEMIVISRTVIANTPKA